MRAAFMVVPEKTSPSGLRKTLLEKWELGGMSEVDLMIHWATNECNSPSGPWAAIGSAE